MGAEGPVRHLKKQDARGEAELEGEGGGVAEGGGRGRVVEDGAQGAGEGGGAGGVDGLRIIIRISMSIIRGSSSRRAGRLLGSSRRPA